MKERITASQQGAKPFVLVPAPFADSLYESLVSKGFSFDRYETDTISDESGARDHMFEGTPPPHEIENAIDEWFREQGIVTETRHDGTPGGPYIQSIGILTTPKSRNSRASATGNERSAKSRARLVNS